MILRYSVTKALNSLNVVG